MQGAGSGLGQVKPEELVGRWVRRPAAWGWSSRTFRIEDARVGRNGRVMVKLSGYRTWQPLNRYLFVED